MEQYLPSEPGGVKVCVRSRGMRMSEYKTRCVIVQITSISGAKAYIVD